jgi:hypothetical protein
VYVLAQALGEISVYKRNAPGSNSRGLSPSFFAFPPSAECSGAVTDSGNAQIALLRALEQG